MDFFFLYITFFSLYASFHNFQRFGVCTWGRFILVPESRCFLYAFLSLSFLRVFFLPRLPVLSCIQLYSRVLCICTSLYFSISRGASSSSTAILFPSLFYFFLLPFPRSLSSLSSSPLPRPAIIAWHTLIRNGEASFPITVPFLCTGIVLVIYFSLCFSLLLPPFLYIALRF